MLYNLLDGMFCDVDMYMEHSSIKARECSLYSRSRLFDVAVLRDEDSFECVAHVEKNADSGPKTPKAEDLVGRIGFFNFDGQCFEGSDGRYEKNKKGIVVDSVQRESDETKKIMDGIGGIDLEISAFPVTDQARTRALQPLLQAVHGGLHAVVLLYEGQHSLPYAEVASKTIRTILTSVTDRSKLKSVNICKMKQKRKSPSTESLAPMVFVFDVQVCLTFADLNRKLKEVLKAREDGCSLRTGKDALILHFAAEDRYFLLMIPFF